MTTLEDLYYGNIIPQKDNLEQGNTYSELSGYIARHQENLATTLTEQQKEFFEKLKGCESELYGMNELEAFISGFKLATRIMIEVMYESSDKEN